jgi:hypothetical protein
LPAGISTYTGVNSGKGTLVLAASGGTGNPSTLVITQVSTFTLSDAQQVAVVMKATYPGAGYALTMSGVNPPVLTINAGVTLQIGTNTVADNNPNIIATSDSKNAASLINGEINLNHIQNDRSYSSGQKLVLINAAAGVSGVLSAVTSNAPTLVAGQDATSFYVTVR